MGRERASFRLEDACWRTGSDGVDRQPDHGGSIAHLTESVQVWDDAELGPNLIPKMTDEIELFSQVPFLTSAMRKVICRYLAMIYYQWVSRKRGGFGFQILP